MPDPTQFDPAPIRAALDRGEVVELDGGTLVLDGEESPSVVLRLAPDSAAPGRANGPVADAGVSRRGARRSG
jgi:hypothetical protein